MPVGARVASVLRSAALVGAVTGQMFCLVIGPAEARGGPAVRSESPRWTGLATPESVAHDRFTDTYLVSNINGGASAAAAKDNNGFIAQLTPRGGRARPWVQGGRRGVTLHAPKGLAVTRARVWVTDIDTVRVFDRRSGVPVAQIAIPGARFLNDIAIGSRGDVYVTDSGVGPDATGTLVPTGTDAVYRIDRGETVHTVVAGTHLNQPNGIYYQSDGSLRVATRGADEILTIDGNGEIVSRYTVPGTVVDGVQVLRGGCTVVSTWQPPGLWWIDADGNVRPFPGLELPAPVADFSVDRKRSRLLLPVLLNDQLLVAKTRRCAMAAPPG